MLSQENRVFDAMWEQNRLDKLGREEAEEASRKQMDAEQKAVLDRQVNELHQFREEEKQLSTEEAAVHGSSSGSALH